MHWLAIIASQQPPFSTCLLAGKQESFGVSPTSLVLTDFSINSRNLFFGDINE